MKSLRRRLDAFWISSAFIVAVACAGTGGTDENPAPDASVAGAASDGSTETLPDALVEQSSEDANGEDAASEPPDPPPPCVLAELTLTVATLAGCDDPGTADGIRGVARFSNPVNVVVGPDGKSYVADFGSSLVRVVGVDGTTTTLLSRPDLQRPFGLALAADGALYLETDDNDLGQHSTATGTIWRVDTESGSASVIARNVGRPRGLAVLPDGRLAMADHMHHVVQLLAPSSGKVSLLAGAYDVPGHVNAVGASARFNEPFDVVVLPNGNLAVSDLGNHRIREVTLGGLTSDYAGSGISGDSDGPVSSATFAGPKGLGLAADGTLYVSDTLNFDIRRIRDGQVVKIAGATQGYLDNALPLTAKFYAIEGIDVSSDGRIVAADGNGGDDSAHHHIRVIDLSSSSLPE